MGTLIRRSLVSKGPGERCPQPVGSGVFCVRSLVSVNNRRRITETNAQLAGRRGMRQYFRWRLSVVRGMA